MTDNVYQLRTQRFPRDTKRLLEKLVAHAHDAAAPLDGIAFVAYVDDLGFIADAVGKAREMPGETRLMLKALDRKLEALERKQR